MDQGSANLKQGDTIKGHWCTDTNGDKGFAPCDRVFGQGQFEWSWGQGKIETDDCRCNVSQPEPAPQPTPQPVSCNRNFQCTPPSIINMDAQCPDKRQSCTDAICCMDPEPAPQPQTYTPTSTRILQS